MANYNTKTRTNYFTVTDEDRYTELFGMLHSEDYIEDFTETKDEKILHGFGSYGDIDCYPYGYEEDGDNESDYDYFLKEIQKILPENEVFAITTIGNEKLCCVDAFVCMVSKDDIKSMDTNTWIEQTAKEMTHIPEFTTKYTY